MIASLRQLIKLGPVRFLSGCLLFSLLCVARAGVYPLPTDLGPTNTFGSALQRSMRLMAHSNPEKKRTVRVAFYGQSINQEIWTVWLTDWIRTNYPHANLVFTNLAVGYSSEILVRPAVADIPNFYPDLMIFHDYGPLNQYEEIIGIARRQTTADILIQTDHIHIPEDLNEPTDPNYPGGLPERAARNYAVLPDIAQRYGAELALIRTYWKKYLQDYNIPPHELLRDGLHPTYDGNLVMEEFLKPYFRVDESFESTAWDRAEVTYEIGKDLTWNGDELKLDFEGNRLDVIVDQTSADPIDVRIDGKRPSEIPELYNVTRADFYPGANWISILRLGGLTPPLDEDWTLRITQFTTNNGVPFARFAVSGSKTGFDGEGSVTERFVSNSGRVSIEPGDWLMLYWTAAYYPILKPLPIGHEIQWRTSLFAKDRFTPSANDRTIENTVTIAQGLARGPHTLTLTRHGSASVAGIRVFNPAARTQPNRIIAPQITEFRREETDCTLTIRAGGRYVVESSRDGRTWIPVSAAIAETQFRVQSAGHLSFFRVRVID